jgi:argininosuccinate lyase
LNDLKLEELRSLSDAFAPDFFDAITLEATLDCHDVVGGTARARVAEAVAAAKRRLRENK